MGNLHMNCTSGTEYYASPSICMMMLDQLHPYSAAHRARLHAEPTLYFKFSEAVEQFICYSVVICFSSTVSPESSSPGCMYLRSSTRHFSTTDLLKTISL